MKFISDPKADAVIYLLLFLLTVWFLKIGTIFFYDTLSFER